MGATPRITRSWAMPSKHTFTIGPIADLIARYSTGIEWVDPCSGWNSPAKYTNDLNPAAPTMFHEHAADFVLRFDAIDGLLFDPPYSPRQIVECYSSFGKTATREDTQNARLCAAVKNNAAPRVKDGGIAICCGWNSNGMGIGRGFELIEILIVAHGAAHNDTIITVERKVEQAQIELLGMNAALPRLGIGE